MVKIPLFYEILVGFWGFPSWNIVIPKFCWGLITHCSFGSHEILVVKHGSSAGSVESESQKHSWKTIMIDDTPSVTTSHILFFWNKVHSHTVDA